MADFKFFNEQVKACDKAAVKLGGLVANAQTDVSRFLATSQKLTGSLATDKSDEYRQNYDAIVAALSKANAELNKLNDTLVDVEVSTLVRSATKKA